ncbi:MAG: HTTM domain-containing protein [Pseudobdellovibrionaceae bacterium]
MALVLICDLISRLPYLNEFYGDQGVLPRGALLTEFSNPAFFSIFNMAGEAPYLYLFSAFGFLIYFAFLLGYQTRLANLLSWIFFVSFTARNPVIAHGGDDLIRMALFWLLFLPSHAFYSVDRALTSDADPRPPTRILNLASFSFFLQLILMYFSTALLKWHPRWVSEGSAIYYSLQLDQFITVFGAWFREFPLSVLQAMTFVTLWAELVIPLLIFIPFRESFFRWIAIGTFISFHFGLFLFFRLGSFPWICIAYWLAFIPESFWQGSIEKLKVRQKALVIFYDGDCGYCLKMVSLIRTFLILPFVEVRKAQENPVLFSLMKEKNSWLVKQTGNGDASFHFQAFLDLLKISPFHFLNFIFSKRIFLEIGGRLYRWQALRRPLMGSLLQRLKLQSLRVKSRLSIQIFVTLCLAVVLYWNIAVFDRDDSVQLPKAVEKFGSYLRLHQQWNMFAPYPWMEDGWLVVEGQLLNGKSWDVLYDQPVSFEKPENMQSKFPTTFWIKYIVNIWHKNYKEHRLYFGRFICRLWNNRHEGDERVNTFKIFYMLEVSPPPGEAPAPIRQEEIWSHYCLEKPANP